MINLDALLSAIQERKANAELAAEALARPYMAITVTHRAGDYQLAMALDEFTEANSPRAVLRQVERDLRVLARHEHRQIWNGGKVTSIRCGFCGTVSVVCDEIADLAHAYAIPTEETDA